MLITLLILLVSTLLWALLERGVAAALKNDIGCMRARERKAEEGWGRGQKALFAALRRAEQAEARLRYFGHEVPK